ncbi:MAG: T9SS type A sorting domain-containing protein [Chloroherpetonaceae bacterium]|nr:T9SS type A sorting domain-containing protein [Chloroherpetonaceae bacterium]
MKIRLVNFLFLFLFSFLFAQNELFAQPRAFQQKISSGHAISPFSKEKTTSGVGNFRVLGVMVQFLEDNDRATSGTGRFGGLTFLSAYQDTIIDPLPHDRAYFQRKLEFLNNYYSKVSDGKTTISGFIPEKIYTVSKRMGDYSPSRRTEDLTPLAELVKEVWEIVDRESPEIDFSQYDHFIIFHCGVGRDIDIVSLTGTDPTPRDLPSITFNERSLKRYLGNQYQGVPVDGGAFKINTTSVIPATESREIDVIGGKTLIQLSTNGLLAASFGGYLGLPDLFNTVTGRSGIGRFGLMDGESFFSFSGLFPPEPSAWERIRLGYASPRVITKSTAIRLPAQGLHQNPDSVVWKIPMNSKEYLLLENRQRRAELDGVRLTRFRNGVVDTVFYPFDQTDFRFENTGGFRGNVVGVKNYDWSLPTDSTRNQPRFNGGLLVWHIDESVIDTAIDSGRVNANRIKGVRLIEADGSPDIGENYGITSAGNGTQGGWVYDMYFQGNSSRVYTNALNFTSQPRLAANSGANTRISISSISASGSEMTATVNFGDELLSPVDGFQVQVPDQFQTNVPPLFHQASQSYFLLSSTGKLWRIRSGEVSQFTTLSLNPNLKPALNGNSLLAVKDSTLFRINVENQSVITYKAPTKITSPPSISTSTLSTRYYIGLSDGRIISLRTDFSQFAERTISNKPVIAAGNFFDLSADSARFSSIEFSLNGESFVQAAYVLAASTLRPSNPTTEGFPTDVFGFFQTDSRRIVKARFKDGQNFVSSVHTILSDLPEGKVTPFALANLENRNSYALIFGAVNKLYAFGEANASMSNFPVELPQGQEITTSPVSCDVNGDGYEEVIVLTKEGRLLIINREGKILTTQSISGGTVSTPAIYPGVTNGKLRLALVDQGGKFSLLDLSLSTANFSWQTLYGNNFNDFQAFRTNVNRPVVTFNEFMPESKVYNYPNPASTETKFRCYLTEPASITVKVFSLTGQKVWENTLEGRGGIDNELIWNLNGIQNGVYFATLQAKALSNGDTKLVKLKVAVVK